MASEAGGCGSGGKKPRLIAYTAYLLISGQRHVLKLPVGCGVEVACEDVLPVVDVPPVLALQAPSSSHNCRPL